MEENKNTNTNINIINTLEKKNEKELINELNKKLENNNYNNIIPKNEDISNIEINKNKITESENKIQLNDYLITIRYTNLICIPYFYFGNIFHFYFSCQCFSSNPIKLSEMPTPPFAIICSECKELSIKI